MKKKIIYCLVMMLCMLLVGCGKSEAVTETEKKIDAIGTVSSDSGDAILEAKEQYEALSSEEKEKVSNYDILQKALEEYEDIAETNLNNAYEALLEAKIYCDDLCSIIYEYWNYNGFECFFDRDEWTRMNNAHNYGGKGSLNRGEFYGDSNIAFENRDAVELLMQSAKESLNSASISDEHKDYYEAVKNLYLMMSEYATFAAGFPEGYSKLTYRNTHSDYQSEYKSCISEIEFLK